MIYYAVIDTNVIVSSLIKGDSIPGFIINLIGNHTIIPIVHNDLIKEYEDVLKRTKFNFNKEDIMGIINGFMKFGLLYGINKTDVKFDDESDKKFYDLYSSFKKEHTAFLITGNKKHFPNENNILSPREFLEKNHKYIKKRLD